MIEVEPVTPPLDPVDSLLSQARPSLLRWASEAIQRGPGAALIVTVDADGDPLIDLWPVARIARMLGARPKLAAKLHKVYSRPRAVDTFPVIVCAPGAAPAVSLQHLVRPRGHYAIAYVKRDREWFYVWSIWPGEVPSAKVWVGAETVGLVQQSGAGAVGYAYERADIEADEELRELLGDDAETVRLDAGFARAAYRDSMGTKPNLRGPRAGAYQYAPMPGHDREPSQSADDYHAARAVQAEAKQKELAPWLLYFSGQGPMPRDTRSPIDRAIDDACGRKKEGP